MILRFFPLNTVKYDAILAGKVKLTGKQMYEKPPIRHRFPGHFPALRLPAAGLPQSLSHPPPKNIFFQATKKLVS
jgi:hypothetical protein